jgi:thiamine-phosphate pyrophosphorylase
MYFNHLNKFYYFCDNFNINEINVIKKIRRVSIIFNFQHINLVNILKIEKIIKYCKKFSISYYFINNIKYCIKYKANGLYIESNYKKAILNRPSSKKFDIIGSAHNQIEYYFKKRQFCNSIFLSPLFYNNKYSNFKILGISKFNLKSLYWDSSLIALGGINSKNIKKIILTRARGIGFKRFIHELKNPAYRLK